MDTVKKIQEISNKIDLLMSSSDWMTKETVHLDNTISQTGTLINVLAEEIRDKVVDLVHNFEQNIKELEKAKHIH